MGKSIVKSILCSFAVLAFMTIGMLNFSGTFVANDRMTSQSVTKFYTPKISALQPAPPLLISGDNGWKTGFASQWVNGSGTWADPYNIKNYAINGTSGNPCIYILNTTKPFRILNCITNTS